MKRAEADQIDAIRQFLLNHAPSSMFPLSNLLRHGCKGGHPRAVRFWIQSAGHQITDVLTVSDEGLVFPQCPTGPWAAVADILRAVGVKGVIGAADQVAAVRRATGMIDPAGLDMNEPHYQLSLKDLIMPQPTDLTLIPLSAAPYPLMCEWRAAFCEEALHFPRKEAGNKGADDIDSYLRDDTHRVLLKDGQPVAMTGFNAVLPEIVQVGGVYTPPVQRGRGYARTAVALHLDEAHNNGVTQSVLSAATPAAARAYEAIGFQRIGDFSMAIWPGRQALHG